jgi:hypothetical protein
MMSAAQSNIAADRSCSMAVNSIVVRKKFLPLITHEWSATAAILAFKTSSGMLLLLLFLFFLFFLYFFSLLCMQV